MARKYYPCSGCQQEFRKGRLRAGYCHECAEALTATYQTGPSFQAIPGVESKPDEVVTFDPRRTGMAQFRSVRTEGASYVRLGLGRAKYAPKRGRKPRKR